MPGEVDRGAATDAAMGEDGCGSTADIEAIADLPETSQCRFELNPPRNFLYPALLLLLSEEPRHGYRLVDPMLTLGFGAVDRASVYRALADLEADGLLRSWDAAPTAGSTRHVYAPTPLGEALLRRWMEVVDAERGCFEHMLKRYDVVQADEDG
ncbi:hypothetical protein BH20ACT2_BH20ACT2_15870 [soil metagenome]